jgi:hypothetical protein
MGRCYTARRIEFFYAELHLEARDTKPWHPGMICLLLRADEMR